MTAKELYDLGCNAYLHLFCEKHGYYYESDAWVGNDIGGVANVGDYYVDMATIRADIDEDAPEEEFIKWHDYCLAAHEFGIIEPSFRSWVLGCPRTSEKVFERLRTLRKDINDLVEKENEAK